MKNYYFESHVTIEPVFDERLELFQKICMKHNFRVAELLLQKRKKDKPNRSKLDSFCTGRDKNNLILVEKMIGLIQDLKNAGFKVWRYKIEAALLDSKIKDDLKLLYGE
jgi:hypothetical protein